MQRVIIAFILVGVALALVKIAIDNSTIDAALQANTDTASATASRTSPTTGTGETAVATFAGGCFWCIESTFEQIEGVKKAVSGYSGGHLPNPTYGDVGGGASGHTEAVQIYYDPTVVSYDALLHYFWRDIDPTDAHGQFADRGSEYRPAIFYHDEAQHTAALESHRMLVESGRFDKPLAVEIIAFEKFWEAEGYHQDYYKKNPFRYKLYRAGSGRDAFLDRTWGDALHQAYAAVEMPQTEMPQTEQDATDYAAYRKPDEDTLRQQLTELQYEVTQNDATERPFSNTYWDHNEEGIYVDIVSGEPLFSSTTKFKSGTGWPSFWATIDSEFIVEKEDFKLLFPRTEVRSRYGNSHLGHLFKDGPAPSGLRYCINSAALKFIPRTELEAQGYGEYVGLF